MRHAYCALRIACCVLRIASCSLLIACCLLPFAGFLFPLAYMPICLCPWPVAWARLSLKAMCPVAISGRTPMGWPLSTPPTPDSSAAAGGSSLSTAWVYCYCYRCCHCYCYCYRCCFCEIKKPVLILIGAENSILILCSVAHMSIISSFCNLPISVKLIAYCLYCALRIVYFVLRLACCVLITDHRSQITA